MSFQNKEKTTITTNKLLQFTIQESNKVNLMSYNWNEKKYPNQGNPENQKISNDSRLEKDSTQQQQQANGNIQPIEKLNHVTLPSLANINNVNTENTSNHHTNNSYLPPHPPTITSTHDQMSTTSIMNPTTSSTTSTTNQTAGRTERKHSGFSLASFDNPLPPIEEKRSSIPSNSPGTAATITSTTTTTANPSVSPKINNSNVASPHNIVAQPQQIAPVSTVPTQTHVSITSVPTQAPVSTTVTTNTVPEQGKTELATATTTAATTAATTPAASAYRPLNVKDALSYLEQVKGQFMSRPDVYNNFLDIMKDFKSQDIDTPGVIERVSTLFKGFPTLIQGFNTFLPDGFRIECSDNPDEPIRVTTPTGTSTLHDISGRKIDLNKNNYIDQQPQQLQQQQPEQQQAQNPPQVSQYPSEVNQMQAPQQPAISTPEVAATTIAEQNKKPADVELTQAISYVNKIKDRFADQPDIYKNFLEILQTYQRDQKPINEVYAQVTVLFQNAPDLLDDFKKFLPDSSMSEQQQQQQQAQQAQQQQAQMNQLQQQQQQGYMYGNVNGYYQPASGMTNAQQNLPPIGSFSPPNNGVPFREDYNETSRPPMVGLPSMIQHEQTIEMTQPQQQQPQQPHGVPQKISNENIPISNMRSGGMMEQYPQPGEVAVMQPVPQGMGQPTHEEQYAEVPVRPEIDLDPSIVPVVPEPTEPIENNLTLVEETSFFDKVKKAIGNKQVYTEFLKILNLFSQDLLEVNELVEKVDYYIGSHTELMDWFKNFVGFKDQPKIIENIVHEKHRLDLDMCEACGPSYKKLPKSDTFMPCSGRDDMCWEVLNDEWVGHPVWASEDSGFIAHRKNQYEETLFKAEEERHEYDFYIESNLRTIQTLETIANKISNMTEEEKQVFKLPPGLGHNSLTIYKKVIRKVYDKERGFEVIDALHEHPAIAVPVILKRLKQKDEEWRRAQREWNKVWRELEQKVYFKSLDHLGLTFKQADKKLLTTKQLISEISSIKVDQNNKRMHWLTPKPKSQLDFDVKDFEIIYDIIKLAFVSIDNVSNYSNPDKERLRDFFCVLISVFFSIPMGKIEEALKKRGLDIRAAPETELSPEQDTEGTSGSKKRKMAEAIELSLNDILRREKYQKLKHPTKDGESNEIDIEMAAEDSRLEEEAESIRNDAKKPWLLGDILDKANANGVVSDRIKFNLFGNTYIYIFIRYLVTLYDRLLEVKNMNETVTNEINSRKTVQFAKDLCLISTQLKDMGLDFVGKDSYQEILHLGERLIVGDIEHQWFEESLRQAFNNKAFKLYTIDKVTQAIVKHAHTLMSDNKTSEILKLYERDRIASSTSTKDQILYRLQARSHMTSTENMFRIQYDKQARHICIQYIALDDLTLRDSTTDDAKWKYYITSYSLPHPTEGIDQEKLKIPFLERILEFEQNEFGSEENEVEDKSKAAAMSRYAPNGVSGSSLKINIAPATYSLDIEEGSIDIFSRKSMNAYPAKENKEHSEKVKELAEKFLQRKVASNKPQVSEPKQEEKEEEKEEEKKPSTEEAASSNVLGTVTENTTKSVATSVVSPPVDSAVPAHNEKENENNEIKTTSTEVKPDVSSVTGPSATHPSI